VEVCPVLYVFGVFNDEVQTAIVIIKADISTRRNLSTEKYSSWDSVVGIATGCRLDHREVEVRVTVGSRNFTFPNNEERLWGSLNLLFNGFLPGGRGLKGRGMKLTTHYQLVPRSRKLGFIHRLPHTSS
jgi:hypothetical protein